MDSQKQLRRSSNKMIAGVAAGVAEYFNLDPALVRLVFVLLALAGGPGVLLYIVLWIVMPAATS
jgi:phage shock protein C